MKKYELSLQQKQISTMDEYGSGNVAGITVSVSIKGKCDESIIKASIKRIIEENDILRIGITIDEDGTIRQYAKDEEIVIDFMHFQSVEEMENWANKLAVKKIDIKGKLCYITGFDIGDEKYGLIINMHHAIGDAWSVALITKQFMAYCNAETAGNTYSYFDYIEKQKEYLNSKRYQNDRKYWINQYLEQNEPTYISDVYSESMVSKRHVIHLDDELTNLIYDYLKDSTASVFSLYTTALCIYLCRLKRTNSFNIGNAILSRTDEHERNTIGEFFNSLSIKFDIDDTNTFRDNIRGVENKLFAALKHHRFNYAHLVEELVKEDKFAGTPYDVYLNYHIIKEKITDDIDIKWYYCGAQTESLSIAINEWNNQGGIELFYDYQTEKFTEEDIERFNSNILTILRYGISNDQLPVRNIKSVDAEEEKLLLYTFNDTDAEVDRKSTVAEIFEKQVSKYSDHIAVEIENEKVTYTEFNQKVNQLARKLRDTGILPNDFVAVMAERSIEMIVGIFAIIKAGAAYVPIDPTYPKERIDYILEDCKPKAILIGNVDTHPEFDAVVLNLFDKNLYCGDNTNLHIINKVNDLLYIIYTSGTSGRPKGVMIEHKSISNLVFAYQKLYGITNEDILLQFASIAFDQSVFDIFSMLLTGGTLCLMPYFYISDPRALERYITERGVTVAVFTPAFMKMLIPENLPTLKVAESGGAAANLEVLNRWHNGRRVFNTYGPTEATVNAVTFELESELTTKLPIGKPASNTKIYILNGNTLCGIDMPGELCIEGIGLARGYLNKPELTAQKFVENPFGEGNIYRTGDLAKWRKDGNIEYLGRIDEQVKIRGFRIELGEIESVLQDEENINDVVAIAKEDSTGEQSIHCYVTSDKEIDIHELRNRISSKLPNYMVPARMLQIDRIPLNKNGKVDSKALPEIEATSEREFVAPRNKNEERIAALFSDILGVKKVGIKDSFFELGGHSLRVIHLINQIEAEKGVHLSYKDIFSNSTVEGIARLLETSNASLYKSLPEVEQSEYYPMSSAQKRLYLINEINDKGTAYNISALTEVKGDLDIERVRNVFNEIIDRHEILRTSFHIINGETVQKIHSHIDADIEYEEIEEITDPASLLHAFVRPYDLDKAPLMRLKVVKSSDKYAILYDTHHIISDGMSTNILINEFVSLYSGEVLEPLKYQYKNYSEWMSMRDISDQKKYWLSQFDDEIPVMELPLDYTRQQKQTFKGKTVRGCIDADIRNKIESLAVQTESTDYMILLSAFYIMLSKYSRQSDIVVGTPISGRTHKDTENMLGMFVNSLAMRGKPESGKRYREFLDEVRENCLKAYENQEYPFEELVEEVHVNNIVSRNPIFDVMFILQNNEDVSLNISGFEFNRIKIDQEMMKFDLTLEITPDAGNFELEFKYSTDLFKETTIKYMMNHYISILEEILNDSDAYIDQINGVNQEEYSLITLKFNDIPMKYDKNTSVAGLFENQVLTRYDQTAVICGDDSITYGVLNRKANQVASRLIEMGVRPDDFIAISADRSIDTFVGVFGILKAGCAFVPIDANYPEERIDYILNDCSPKAILNTKIKLKTALHINTIDLLDQEVYSGAAENPVRNSSNNNIAYTIYTSGTTGKPKGVMISGLSLINHLNYVFNEYYMKEGGITPLFTNPCFDFAIPSIFTSLCYGGEVRIYQDMEEMIYGREAEKAFSLIKITPSQFNCIDMTKKVNCTAKAVVFGGEQFNNQLVRKVKKIFGEDVKIFNEYGPTETTVFVTDGEIKDKKDFPITIGKPVWNCQIYILQGDSLCGIGIPGEICIAGDCVAKGYLNNMILTNEKFVKNPFGSGKMYKSGDLGRWLADGNIDYIGRIDDQVKIRGFRVEPSEIENIIRNIPGIDNAAVVVNEDEQKENALYAYIVAKEQLDLAQIKITMHKMLPDYMIPSYMMQIDSIPVTKNGKLNKAMLPAIEINRDSVFTEPENEVERILVEIYKDILNLDRVSTSDNFFDIGGHSLRALRVVNEIEANIGIRLSLHVMFENPTVRGLASYIINKQAKGNAADKSGLLYLLPAKKVVLEDNLLTRKSSAKESGYSPIPKTEKREYYPMSSNQKRMFVVNEIDEVGISYNMPVAMEIKGKLDIEKVRKIFKQIIERHEVLRTSFHMFKDQAVQKIADSVEAELEYEETDGQADIEKLLIRFVKPFSLDKAPLMRMKVVKISEESSIILFDMHHIISDALSANIITREFSVLYNGGELTEQTVQYKDFSEWMRTRDFSAQKEYWMKEFNGELPILNLPLDHARPKLQSFRGNSVRENLDPALTEKITEFSKKTGATEYMILLSAVMVLLGKYSNQDEIIVGTPISGRTHKDTENMLGVFINTLALKGKPRANINFNTLLDEIRETCLKAYENQEYPFEELVEALKVKRDMARNPIFDVMFILQNNEEASLDANGLVIKDLENHQTISKFDLCIEMKKSNDTYSILYEYCTDLFTEDTIRIMIRHFICLLNQLLQRADDELKTISMVDDYEKNILIDGFNQTREDYDESKTVVDLFERKVKEIPNEVAVVCQGRQLTFGELNRQANKLARKLIKLGAARGEYIAISTARSEMVLVAMLGILKTGAAYLPIDPDTPVERVSNILSDSKCKVVITSGYNKSFDVEGLINVDLLSEIDEDNTNLNIAIVPEDVCYLIYTSGFTGMPKGTLLMHSSIVNYCDANKSNISGGILGNCRSIVSVTTISFDIFVTETIMALVNGMTCVMANESQQNNQLELRQLIMDEHVDVLQTTPSKMKLYLSDPDNIDYLNELKVVLLGGEKFDVSLLEVFNKYPELTVANVFGPTETTVWSTAFVIPKGYEGNVVIGRPIANTSIYIMNGNVLSGIGVPGEICIAGNGLAKGYLNRSELTEEKFVADMFNEGRIYRTGDIGRWLLDGTIEYYRRADDQIKLRGYRIELGEIENVIRKTEKVKDVVVVLQGEEEKSLCAYFVSEEENIQDELRNEIRRFLPEYMVPSYFMQLDRMPLNGNGKLNKKALPQVNICANKEHKKPTNQMEEKLVAIFVDALQIPEIGIGDNFFDFGGNSIRAIKAINQIEQDMGVRIQLKELFLNPAISELSKLIIEEQKNLYSPIPMADIKECYPMSSVQKRLFIIQEIDETRLKYNMPAAMEINGKLDVEKIQSIFNALIERHEALRTRFMIVNGETLQKIEKHIESEVEYEEIEGDVDQKQLLHEFVRPFDLGTAPLMRLKVVKLSDNRNIVMFDMHHIISDASSINIIMDEFSTLYSGGSLQPLRVQYKDYSEWLRKRDISKQRDYWINIFRDDIPVINMPLDYTRPVVQSFRGDCVRGIISKSLKEKIMQLAHTTGTTEYMVLLSALMILLEKYSMQEDIIVGSPISGRIHKDTESMLGMFVNTLALRSKPEKQKNYKQFLKEIKEICLGAYENQEYQFEDLVDAVVVNRDISRNPIFDIMFVFQNNESVDIEADNLDVTELEGDYQTSKFDLDINIGNFDDGYYVDFEYCIDLFKESSIDSMLNHYCQIIEEIVDAPDLKLCEYCGISEEEKCKVLQEFNDTAIDYHREMTVIEMFEEQVKNNPDKTAIVIGNENFTYKEINAKANQLAYRLRSLGVKPDDFVVISAERSTEMIIGVLGILKSGAAFVPIDADYPIERIDYIIDNCRPKAVLSGYNVLKTTYEVPAINLLDWEVYSGEDSNPERVNSTENLVYAIYTSGTTGKPKGVMIKEKSLVNLLSCAFDLYYKDGIGKTPMFTNPCFDFTISIIFVPLCFGGELWIYPDLDNMLYSTLANTEFAYLKITPSQFNSIDMSKDILIKVRLICFGGEQFDRQLIRRAKKLFGKDVLIYNEYGPTETTVFITAYEVEESHITIGKPIWNTQVYILNEIKLCGIGVPGEICIGGDPVAVGYINNPELTDKKFIPNPFGSGRIYRTGDLGRWLDDGSVDFMGRIDDQVKIRGFRVEPSEVENVIRQIDGIENAAVVIVEENDEKTLCAYLVSERKLQFSEVKAEMRKVLPDYMIPTYMMQIDFIPVTKNAKLDKRALPKIEIKSEKEYVAPSNKTEEKVLQIFKDVLGVQVIGVTDNFFDIGGHSLRATRVMNQIEKETGIKLPLKQMFLHPTVRELSEIIISQNGMNYEQIPLAEAKDYYPMSSTQKRLYLINQIDDEGTTYNMPECVEIHGEMDFDRISSAFDKLVERHEALRTSFHMINGEAVQKIDETAHVNLEYMESSTEIDPEELLHDWVRPFDFKCPPLMRAKVVKNGSKVYMLFDMHHIISDGMSNHILIREFSDIYNGKELEPLRVQYKDYSEWMLGRNLDREREYWLSEFEGEVPVLSLPLDHSRPKIQSYDGDCVSLQLGNEIRNKVSNLARETNSTEYMVLISVFYVMLEKYSRQSDIVIGTPIAGRTNRDMESMLGMFVNTLALRCHPEEDKAFIDFLGEVREVCLSAYHNQEYPFEELVDHVNVQRDVSRNPLFDVMFVMQNHEKSILDVKEMDLVEIEHEHRVSKFDLSVDIIGNTEGYYVEFEFCKNLFNRDTICNMVNHYTVILNEILKAPNEKINHFDMISSDERKQILAWNETSVEYNCNSIIEMFEKQVEVSADKTAVVFEDRNITYGEFNNKVNQLARKIRNLGVRADDSVVIIAERSIETIIAIYAVLKSGGAYVPVEPSYPADRIEYIINDCNARAVILDRTIGVEFGDINVINLYEPEVFTGNTDNLKFINNGSDLAYIIYTSGTTGTPKGVLVEHHNLADYVNTFIEKFEIDEKCNILQQASITFDTSVEELYPALVSGGQITVISRDMLLDVKRACDYINNKKVTLISCTPLLLNEFNRYNSISTVDTYISGGDVIRYEYISNLIRRTKIFNTYGPTEATVCASYYEMSEESCNSLNIPVGAPIANKRIFIIDSNECMCGIGVPGELCIAGDGIVRGYLNNTELTNNKFVSGILQEERVYKTGDLARWLSDGNIEFMGRIDDQIKIRGYRIELGEVESNIRKIRGVLDAAVIIREYNNENALCAYVKLEGTEIGNIRSELRNKLPEYMIPAYMMQIDEIPVNKNGKLNKAALPDILDNFSQKYVEARNEMEAKLVEIFEGVLERQHLSVTDSFFELGGHSLKATRVINQIESEIGIRLQLKDFFMNPSVEGLCKLLEIYENKVYEAIPKVEEKEYYLMSPAQKRMYLINEIDGASTTYNMPVSMQLAGELDIERVKDIFAQLCRRHEALRTSFHMVEGQAVQKIHDDITMDIELLDISEDESKFEEFIRPFDLTKAPLFRVRIIKKNLSESIIRVDMHHIISDGVSIGILQDEFMKLYRGEKLEDLRVQYKDYSEWFNERNIDEQKQYWINELSGDIPILDLPLDYLRPQMQSHGGKWIYADIQSELWDKISKKCLEHGTTEFMFMLAVFMVELSKYSRQDDIIVGSPVTGRVHRDTENIIGMFVNTLALRGRTNENKTFAEFLNEMKDTCLRAYENQEYPFEELVDSVNVKRDTSRNPLFDVMFVMQNMKELKLQLGGIEIEDVSGRDTVAKFDISVYITENDGVYTIGFDYCSDLFSQSTMEMMLQHYMVILKEVVDKIDMKIGDISVLNNSERKMLLSVSDNLNVGYPVNATVVDLFEEQATRTPNNIAVASENTTITYRELNERANQLARTLRNHGVRADDFVALITERSIEMIIGIYAVIKAGGAYVPIDTTYPFDRIEFMLNDCKPKVVLIGKYNLEKEVDAPVMDLFDQTIYDMDVTNLPKVNKPEDLMYVIYTSGTTGKPKGVMIENRNVVRLFKNDAFQFDITERDVWTMFHSYCFDFSIWEIYGATLFGGKLVVVPRETTQDALLMLNLIHSEKVTVLNQVPTSFYNIMQADMEGHCEKTQSLRYLIFGGEALKPVRIKEWYYLHENLKVINMYGITETTVHVTYKEITDKEVTSGVSNIGTPIPTLSTYIMNNNSLCGIGMPGEICVGGAGVARGYLNRDELTSTRFVENLFSKGRLYRSGDLGRWTEDGNIEYLGRIDEQVKIRGFRIELGEIDAVLRRQEEIKDVAVIASNDKNGEKHIIAYIVSDDVVDFNAIRKKISIDIPEYMIPAYIVQIGKIPMTKNGKLDKKALPEVKLSSEEYIEPKAQTQILVANVFKNILEAEKVGLKDNFFTMGGHSLRATRAINQIEKETGVRIPLKTFFISPTVEEIAAALDTEKMHMYKPIPEAEEKELYEMSSNQKRLFIINELDETGVAYNMPTAIEVSGLLDINKVKETFAELLDRHKLLRTAFIMNEGQMVQKVLPAVDAEVEVCEYDKSISEILDDFVRPFDLSNPPLIRIEAVRQNENKHLLLFDMHHIISDAVTINIIIREFSTLYTGDKLDDAAIQYIDYSEWMKQRDISDQKEYWLSEFSDEIPVLDLPLDFNRPQTQSFRGKMLDGVIDSELTNKIKAYAQHTGITEYMILLSAVMILLTKYSAQEDILIGTPISGRTHKDTENMLGMFVNTLVMRGKPVGNKKYSDFLNEIKETCLKGYENQEFPFDELVEKVNAARDMSRNPIFDVMFTLQNFEHEELTNNELQFNKVNIGPNIAKFDLNFMASEQDDHYALKVEYCVDLFKEETVLQMQKHLLNILGEIMNDSDILIEDITGIDDQEKQFLMKINETYMDYPSDKSVVELLNEQIGKTPDNIAVVYKNQSISYRELGEKSDNIAERLREAGVTREDFVVIFAERSLEMIIGICGILKVGGAYVPIDPTYPSERIEYILSDCDPKAVLVGQNVVHLNVDVTQISLFDDKLYGRKSVKVANVNKPTDLAYVIYTSGTTGKPKGVLIENHSIIKLVKNMDYCELNEDTVILQTGSLAFDASTFEVWGALLNGGRLCLIDSDDLINVETLSRYMKEYNVNTMFITTVLFNQMLSLDESIFDQLKVLLFGGEKTSEKHVQILQNRNLHINFRNVYGPTETTTFASSYIIRNDDIREKTPIGKPLSNTQLYVLNKNNLAGIDMPGELCIAGDGVSRGYLKYHELTEKAFVDNPFGTGKMYRSGDLVRWRKDGNVEYLGRIDDQVKIRGFRIEIGEIESIIRKLEYIKDVTVVVRDKGDGEKYICAYGVSNGQLDMDIIRNFLRKELPEYMVPTHMMQIDTIPINKSGKVDRYALPEIEIKSSRTYVAPETEIQKNLVRVFEGILGVTPVGIMDNFFELGGDSIKAIRIISKLREIGYEVSIKDLMQLTTIEMIGENINKASEEINYEQGEISGLVPYTPIQKAFFSWNLAKPSHFNQSFMITAKHGFSTEILNTVFMKLVEHHDALRTVFYDDCQRVLSMEESKQFDLYEYDLKDIDNLEKIGERIQHLNNEAQAGFDLKNGPLLRAALYRTANGDHLLICVHHLVVDGVSWRILMEDFKETYIDCILNKEVILPPKTVSFKDWSEALVEYSRSDMLNKEIPYWKEVVESIPYFGIMPEATLKTPNGIGKTTISLDEMNTEDLLYKVAKAFGTEINDILLTALTRAVCKWKNKEGIAVSLEGHGREEIHVPMVIDRTVGWFTTMYPVVLRAYDELDKCIIETKEKLRKVPNNGVGFGIIRYLLNRFEGAADTDISFNYLGHLDQEIHVEDEVTISPYSVGCEIDENNVRQNPVTVDGSIYNNRLSITISYQKALYSDESVINFAKLYKESLEEIIQYCIQRNARTKTASDYDNELTSDELTELSDMFQI